jgi:hypothetical protein
MSEEVAALPRRRDAIRQAWSARLDRFASSRLSVVAFCRSEGVSAQAFYYWKHKLAAQEAIPLHDGPRLLPVRLLANPTPVELALPTGAVLRLAPGCDLAFVRALVAALGDAPC